MEVYSMQRFFKTNIIAIFALLLTSVVLCSCVNNTPPEEPTKDAPGSSAPRELEREKGLLQDEQIPINIPAQYKTYDSLIDIDDQYYYLQDSVYSEYWKWIALDRKTGEVIEYAPIDINLDGKFTLGFQGDLYTCTIKWNTDVYGTFKILKLGKDGSIKTCFEASTRGYPSAMPYNNTHVVLDYCTKTKGKLFDLDLLTGEETVIMEYDVKEAANGLLFGTRICGLDYPSELPSDKGFCYTVDELAENPVEQYAFNVYYYSFADKKSSFLSTLEGSIFGYIGGDRNAFIPRLWRGGILQEGTDSGVETIYAGENAEIDDAICIYINEDGEYIRYIVPPDPELSNDNIRGSGVLGDGAYIAYGDGVHYFDTKSKKYDSIRFFVGNTDGLGFKGLDIYDEVTGYNFDGTAFYFTSKDSAGALTLHKVTGAK
jgi:hypothetical protein